MDSQPARSADQETRVEILPGTLARYYDRRTKFSGLHSVRQWTFKVYEITPDNDPLAEEVLNAALEQFPNFVQWPESDEAKQGFVIVHQGDQAVWVLVHFWLDDILRQFVFCSSLAAPTKFAASPMPGFNACVWELAVTQHERNAWVQHVLADPQSRQIENYQSDVLSINFRGRQHATTAG